MHQPPASEGPRPNATASMRGTPRAPRASASLAKVAWRPALCAVLLASLAAVTGGRQAPALSAAPSTPAWPEAGLIDAMRGLVAGYYAQAADVADFPAELGNCIAYSYVLLAPEGTADMAAAWKDPDRLWEAAAYCATQAMGPGAGVTACHDTTTEGQAVDCAGHRLAQGLGRTGYGGGTTLYQPAQGYYGNRAAALAAGEGALYHAFVHDYQAPNGPRRPHEGTCPAVPSYGAGGARTHRCYHKRLIRAYERHQHELVLRILTDPDPGRSLSASREAGLLATSYARTVQAAEELGAWSPVTGATDRRDALALVNALNQRLWWEWVWTNQEGPRTAGLAEIGAQATFDGAAKVPAWTGADRFALSALPLPLRSLRQAAPAGILFDADYAMPGVAWCTQFAVGDPSRALCEAHAAGLAAHSAGPNLGSIAEEWLWSFAGARAGMSMVEGLMLGDDPDLPATGAVGANRSAAFPGVPNVAGRPEYAVVTDRLGFAVAGWHGGGALTDDLEWTWAPTGGAPGVTAIRTLSAGEHDGEPQAGRLSLGEDAFDGGRYAIDGQEAAGGIENHYPGPSALYGATLWQLTLEDRTSAGLSASAFDPFTRNTPDEFNAWLWLLRSTLQRCRGAGIVDPADPRCAALGGPDIALLYTRPDAVPGPTILDAQWHGLSGPQPRVPASHVGAPELSACGMKAGVPWRRHGQQPTGGPQSAPTMVDEVGGDAWSDLVPTLAGALRVLAARHAVEREPAARAEQAAWYGDAYDQLEALIAHYGPGGLGHVPGLEHSSCLVAAGNTLTSHLAASGLASVEGVLAARAAAYTRLALWYAWLDGSWLDVDAGIWDGEPVALPRVASAAMPDAVQTGIQLQNLDPVRPAKLNLALYPEGTGNAVLELHPDAAPAGSRNVFLDATDPAAPYALLDGAGRTPLQAGRYGALARANRALGAIVRFDWPATRGAALFADAPRSSDLVVPWVARAAAGIASELVVQNAGTELARVVATLHPQGSPATAATIEAILAPGASRALPLGALPPGFVGWARIKSEAGPGVPPAYHPQPLAAYATARVDPASHPFPVSAAFGLEAQPAAPPTSTLFVPLWRAGQVVGATTLDTRMALANPGTLPVDVTVTFQRSPQSDTCQTVPGGWSTTRAVSLPAGGSVLLDQDPGASGLPADCFGSATIEVDPPAGRVVAAVIDETDQPLGPVLLSAFNAPPSTDAAARVALPLYRRGWAGLTTGIQVVNVGSGPITADVTFVPAVGGGGPVTVSKPIAARDSANWWPGSLPQVPDTTYGSAVVQATGPVVVLVNDYPLQDGLDPATYLGLASP